MRRGNCLLILALLAGCMIGGFYFLLRTPGEAEKGPSKKPRITSFAKDISGTWKAKFVKINPPRGRGKDYKPGWYNNNPRDYDEVISLEIGKDLQIKRLKWAQVSTGFSENILEWFGPEKWKYSHRESKGRPEESRGQCERDLTRLSLKSYSPRRQVEECSFSISRLPDVPAKYKLDGGFRQGDNPGEIEAEIMLYAPELKQHLIEPGKLQIKLSPFGFQFSVSRFVGENEEIKKMVDEMMGKQTYHFSDLKKMRISGARDIDLHKLPIKGYPGNGHLALKGINASFRFGQSRNEEDRVFIEQISGKSQAFVEHVHSAHWRAKVVFMPGGTGKLFTHNGEMEFQLYR